MALERQMPVYPALTGATLVWTAKLALDAFRHLGARVARRWVATGVRSADVGRVSGGRAAGADAFRVRQRLPQAYAAWTVDLVLVAGTAAAGGRGVSGASGATLVTADAPAAQPALGAFSELAARVVLVTADPGPVRAGRVAAGPALTKAATRLTQAAATLTGRVAEEPTPAPPPTAEARLAAGPPTAQAARPTIDLPPIRSRPHAAAVVAPAVARQLPTVLPVEPRVPGRYVAAEA